MDSSNKFSPVLQTVNINVPKDTKSAVKIMSPSSSLIKSEDEKENMFENNENKSLKPDSTVHFRRQEHNVTNLIDQMSTLKLSGSPVIGDTRFNLNAWSTPFRGVRRITEINSTGVSSQVSSNNEIFNSPSQSSTSFDTCPETSQELDYCREFSENLENLLQFSKCEISKIVNSDSSEMSRESEITLNEEFYKSEQKSLEKSTIVSKRECFSAIEISASNFVEKFKEQTVDVLNEDCNEAGLKSTVKCEESSKHEEFPKLDRSSTADLNLLEINQTYESIITDSRKNQQASLALSRCKDFPKIIETAKTSSYQSDTNEVLETVPDAVSNTEIYTSPRKLPETCADSSNEEYLSVQDSSNLDTNSSSEEDEKESSMYVESLENWRHFSNILENEIFETDLTAVESSNLSKSADKSEVISNFVSSKKSYGGAQKSPEKNGKSSKHEEYLETDRASSENSNISEKNSNELERAFIPELRKEFCENERTSSQSSNKSEVIANFVSSKESYEDAQKSPEKNGKSSKHEEYLETDRASSENSNEHERAFIPELRKEFCENERTSSQSSNKSEFIANFVSSKESYENARKSPEKNEKSSKHVEYLETDRASSENFNISEKNSNEHKYAFIPELRKYFCENERTSSQSSKYEHSVGVIETVPNDEIYPSSGKCSHSLKDEHLFVQNSSVVDINDSSEVNEKFDVLSIYVENLENELNVTKVLKIEIPEKDLIKVENLNSSETANRSAEMLNLDSNEDYFVATRKSSEYSEELFKYEEFSELDRSPSQDLNILEIRHKYANIPITESRQNRRRSVAFSKRKDFAEVIETGQRNSYLPEANEVCEAVLTVVSNIEMYTSPQKLSEICSDASKDGYSSVEDTSDADNNHSCEIIEKFKEPSIYAKSFENQRNSTKTLENEIPVTDLTIVENLNLSETANRFEEVLNLASNNDSYADTRESSEYCAALFKCEEFSEIDRSSSQDSSILGISQKYEDSRQNRRRSVAFSEFNDSAAVIETVKKTSYLSETNEVCETESRSTSNKKTYLSSESPEKGSDFSKDEHLLVQDSSDTEIISSSEVNQKHMKIYANSFEIRRKLNKILEMEEPETDLTVAVNLNFSETVKGTEEISNEEFCEKVQKSSSVNTENSSILDESSEIVDEPLSENIYPFEVNLDERVEMPVRESIDNLCEYRRMSPEFSKCEPDTDNSHFPESIVNKVNEHCGMLSETFSEQKETPSKTPLNSSEWEHSRSETTSAVEITNSFEIDETFKDENRRNSIHASCEMSSVTTGNSHGRETNDDETEEIFPRVSQPAAKENVGEFEVNEPMVIDNELMKEFLKYQKFTGNISFEWEQEEANDATNNLENEHTNASFRIPGAQIHSSAANVEIRSDNKFAQLPTTPTSRRDSINLVHFLSPYISSTKKYARLSSCFSQNNRTPKISKEQPNFSKHRNATTNEGVLKSIPEFLPSLLDLSIDTLENLTSLTRSCYASECTVSENASPATENFITTSRCSENGENFSSEDSQFVETIEQRENVRVNIASPLKNLTVNDLLKEIAELKKNYAEIQEENLKLKKQLSDSEENEAEVRRQLEKTAVEVKKILENNDILKAESEKYEDSIRLANNRFEIFKEYVNQSFLQYYEEEGKERNKK